jgi:hypothetical protein
MKNMSTVGVIFGCFEFTLLGAPEEQRPFQRSLSFLTEGYSRQNLTTFFRLFLWGSNQL